MAANRFIMMALISLVASFIAGCDLDRHDECEWYLVPEKDHIQYVANGWVSMCARNYSTKKQRCFLRMKIDEAEKVYNKAVTFSSLDLGKGAIKEIKSYKTCNPK